MQIGEYEVSIHEFGQFRLDGGSMFGSVPKNIWSKKIPPDIENCIPLASRALLIKSRKQLILVDAGLGSNWDSKYRQIYDVHHTPLLQAADVTDVLLTHLHFDHAGGISQLNSNTNTCELVFPKAIHYLQEKNYQHAQNPTPKDKASYLNCTVQPLKQAQLHLLDGESEVFKNIFVHPINGHTPGQQWIEIRSPSTTLAFPSDLIPTAHHLLLPFHMGYDLCASTLLQEKKDFLDRAVQGKWIVVFQHDLEIISGTVCLDSKGNYAFGERVSV